MDILKLVVFCRPCLRRQDTALLSTATLTARCPDRIDGPASWADAAVAPVLTVKSHARRVQVGGTPPCESVALMYRMLRDCPPAGFGAGLTGVPLATVLCAGARAADKISTPALCSACSQHRPPPYKKASSMRS
jgi:hypothetical protein